MVRAKYDDKVKVLYGDISFLPIYKHFSNGEQCFSFLEFKQKQNNLLHSELCFHFRTVIYPIRTEQYNTTTY